MWGTHAYKCDLEFLYLEKIIYCTPTTEACQMVVEMQMGVF